jgi:16S rRNA (guanine(527)-N(7))-methyltransferase RsmG
MSDADDREKIMETIEARSPARIPDKTLLRLGEFVEEYLRWGRSIHIVSRRDPGNALTSQIVESLHMLDFAGSLFPGGIGSRRVADIGTGYGFPGLVWCLLQDDLAMTLLERKDKCIAFLEMVIKRFGMEGVIAVRADAGRTEIGRRFDIITTKAAGRLSAVIPIVSGLIQDDGVYVTIKEADWEWEMEGLDSRGMELVGRRELPGMVGVLLAFGKKGYVATQ